MEEARVECAGWLCTLECKSGCSTTRKRASNPGTARDTCTPRHCKDEKLGKKPCVVGEPGCRPGSQSQGVVTYMSPVEAFATGIKTFDWQKVCLIA